MIEVAEIEHSIASMFLDLIGEPATVGLIALMVISGYIAATRIGFEAGLLILLPFIVVLASRGLLPVWIIVIAALGVGTVIAMAFKRYTER